MLVNSSAPIALRTEDMTVPVAEWEQLLMVWTLRALHPEVEGFTTLSFAIQKDGDRVHVIERLDGACTHADRHGCSLSRTFEGENAREKALDYFMQQASLATPPCTQGALPGLVEAAANFIETYTYYFGYGGHSCAQSHARIAN